MVLDKLLETFARFIVIPTMLQHNKPSWQHLCVIAMLDFSWVGYSCFILIDTMLIVLWKTLVDTKRLFGF